MDPSYDNVYGPISRIPFDTADINLGGGWHSATNQITVPLTGKYYVIVDVSSCDRLNMQFELYVNGIKTMLARYLPYIYNITFTAPTARGQSGVLQLTLGDVLYLRLPYNTMCFFAQETTFSGLYLGP